ncbi:RdRP-domain-containing protein [Rickenella mellea]|uniref:RNA-dependent RNA polymerase n=1 Tax=Rickenella mellea TaxID=50990 RepID=A0A4Y7QBC4_9AGAM|nr:RdRP-domain-containing protein [Rickenella mellea]
MEFRMEGIAVKANRYEVTEALAKALHTSDFSTEKRPINFQVILNEGIGGVRNNGTGLLTLPEEGIGKKFRRYLSEKKISIRVLGRRINFRPSHHQPRHRTIETLQKVPYQDPSIDQERDEKLLQLDKALRVNNLQFGLWSIRPKPQTATSPPVRGIFCSEWDRSYTTIGNALLWIEYDHKLLRIQLGESSLDEIANSLVIKFSSVQNLWIGYEIGNPFLCFDLLTPPVLECEWFNRTITGVIEEDSRKFRQRIGSIDDGHAIVAPYAHHVRVSLYKEQTVEEFAELCRIAGLRTPQLAEIDSERHSLFTSKKINQLQKWFENLDWPVAFQLEALLHNGLLHSDHLLVDLRRPLSDLCKDHPERVAEILKNFHWDLRTRQTTETVLKRFQRICTRELQKPQKPIPSGGLFQCHHVTFTPTRITLEGPYAVQSNRVIRQYPQHQDHFVRVDFRDEDRVQYRWDREVDGTTFLQTRVGGILKDGFYLGGRHFEFLAYSSSALRSHAVWFMNPFIDSSNGNQVIDSWTIRHRLGNFKDDLELLSCPSKYAARLAQAFTATDPSVAIERDQWEEIDDIYDQHTNERKTQPNAFTDGVGTISRELSDRIWSQLCADRTDRGHRTIKPSAYQIRFLGYKGMVSVDDQLSGIKMCLRKSMKKFPTWETDRAEIEIAGYFSKAGPMYLNRQLIMILEDRDVDKDVFMGFQEQAVADARTAHDTVKQLRRILRDHNLCNAYKVYGLLENLNNLGLDLRHKDPSKSLNSPFLDRVIHFAVNTVLHDIKYRARIPVSDSWKLVGVADEGPAYEEKGHENVYTLTEGEIFVCVQENFDSEPKFIEGNCIISRSPTVHPGDVKRVWAIGKPPDDMLCLFRNLVNVVVFPCKGQRSMPSCLAGGDLDGDLYDVSQDPALLPRRVAEPAEYAGVPKQVIDLEALKRDAPDEPDLERLVFPHVCDFVVEYINSDVLGLLSDNHLIMADQSSKGVFDEGCLKLAELCSQAVDYPKNGRPVDIRDSPRRLIPYKPDWKKGEEDGPRRTDFYESSKALGHLYRSIDIQDRSSIKRIPMIPPGLHADPITCALKPIVIGKLPNSLSSKNNSEFISKTFLRYADELRYICVVHTLSDLAGDRLTEEEVVVGSILAQSTQRRWRSERNERMRRHSTNLVQEVRRDFLPKLSGTGVTEDEMKASLQLSWDAWLFSAQRLEMPGPDGPFGLSSFGLIALGTTFEVLDMITRA